jgi:ketosteroid isomerase-like protein
MNQDNIDVIQKVYEAFNAGDLATVLSHLAAEADWTNYGSATVPYVGHWVGTSEIPAFFQAIAESTTDAKVTPERFFSDGDTVIALARYTATVRATGAHIDTPLAHFFTIKNGKISKWVGFSDTAAVAAAHTRAAGAP